MMKVWTEGVIVMTGKGRHVGVGGRREQRARLEAARAVYDVEPFYMPTGQRHDGVELCRKFDYEDAPAYRQTLAQEIANAAIAAYLKAMR